MFLSPTSDDVRETLRRLSGIRGDVHGGEVSSMYIMDGCTYHPVCLHSLIYCSHTRSSAQSPVPSSSLPNPVRPFLPIPHRRGESPLLRTRTVPGTVRMGASVECSAWSASLRCRARDVEWTRPACSAEVEGLETEGWRWLPGWHLGVYEFEVVRCLGWW